MYNPLQILQSNAYHFISLQDLKYILLNSYQVDRLGTLKLVFHFRDIKFGRGDRLLFMKCMRILYEFDNLMYVALSWITYFGRWKDLLDLLDFIHCDDFKHKVYSYFAKQLKTDLKLMNQNKNISLCAKWAPTENGSVDRKYHSANEIAKILNVNMKQYRKQYLAPLRKYLEIPERRMCFNDWNNIDFNFIPKSCLDKNTNAITKNTNYKLPIQRKTFINSLVNCDVSQIIKHHRYDLIQIYE